MNTRQLRIDAIVDAVQRYIDRSNTTAHLEALRASIGFALDSVEPPEGRETTKHETYDERELRLADEAGYIKTEIEISRRFLAYQCSAADISYWAGRTAKWQCVGDDLEIIVRVGEIDEATGKIIANHICDWPRAVRLAVEKYPSLLDESKMDMSTGDEWVQLAALGELRYG